MHSVPVPVPRLGGVAVFRVRAPGFWSPPLSRPSAIAVSSSRESSSDTESEAIQEIVTEPLRNVTKIVAVVQSNYIPWKGYFDLIAAVDEFILYDEVQFTKRDWRNRNRIKTPHGTEWLTVPVRTKGRYHQTIREAELEGDAWAANHWKALTLNYAKAPFFEDFAGVLRPLYLQRKYTHLSDLNRTLLEAVCAYLGIQARISWASDYHLLEGRSERLAGICTQAGATEYLSGPAARDYLDLDVFAAQGVAVRWFDYDDYPEYPQLWGEFRHDVSIVDMAFNCGREATSYMKCGSVAGDD